MNDIDLAVPLMDGPSYDRACGLVPSEYVEAWEWFLGEEQRGGVWTSLPHHTKEDSPQYQYRLRIGSDFFPVTRDSGIFWPGQDRVKQDPDKIFALSVHNSKKSFYTDVPPLYLDDGTWVIKYSVQAPGTVGFRDQNYNRKMLNCMECGVPVGVIFATEVGYKVLGLAFVERFEPENGWFVLHGPVHKGGPDPRFAPDMSYLKRMPVDIEFAGQGATDDEKVRYALRRERLGSNGSASSSLLPMTAVARCRTAASAKLSRLHISRITRDPNRRLPATAFCFGATFIPYLMLT